MVVKLFLWGLLIMHVLTCQSVTMGLLGVIFYGDSVGCQAVSMGLLICSEMLICCHVVARCFCNVLAGCQPVSMVYLMCSEMSKCCFVVSIGFLMVAVLFLWHSRWLPGCFYYAFIVFWNCKMLLCGC